MNTRKVSNGPRLNKGWHEIEWLFDDFGPYATGDFSHAYYRFADDLPTLERMGVIELRVDYAQGFRPVANHNGSRLRADGIAVTRHCAWKLIDLDSRFRASMDRVLTGGVALPDFELPKAKCKRMPKQHSVEERKEAVVVAQKSGMSLFGIVDGFLHCADGELEAETQMMLRRLIGLRVYIQQQRADGGEETQL